MALILGIHAAPAARDANRPSPTTRTTSSALSQGKRRSHYSQPPKNKEGIRHQNHDTGESCSGRKGIGRENGACECRRELTSNGLTDVQQHIDNTIVLGEGESGIVHRRRCKKIHMVYAIATISPVGCELSWLEGRVLQSPVARVSLGTCSAS